LGSTPGLAKTDRFDGKQVAPTPCFSGRVSKSGYIGRSRKNMADYLTLDTSAPSMKGIRTGMSDSLVSGLSISEMPDKKRNALPALPIRACRAVALAQRA
jgi:hypothetical protein